MTSNQLAQLQLLSNVSANTTGSEFKASLGRGFTFYIEPSGTPNATVKIQAKTPKGNWVDIDVQTVTSTDPIIIQDGDGQYIALRGLLQNYSSGTFDVTATLTC